MREKYLGMLNKTGNNTFNIDKKFDYSTVRAMVIQSLERIVREELNRHIGSIINLHKIGIQGDEDVIVVVANTGNPFDDQGDTELSASPLRLKIRNTTEYLKWRIAILKRDDFKCQVCLASIKDNKSVRLEVHHAKTFDDICKENNITTIKGALTCKEIWSLDNGISLCYGCHKNIEKIRTELKNMFVRP
jgi:hypothetical protein